MAGRTVAAAPQVASDPRPLRLEPYDNAARELGWPEWGSAEAADGPPRLVLRVAPDRAVLGVLLPPGTPAAQVNRWLQGVSEAQGWKHVELYSAGTPAFYGTRAVVRDGIREVAPGRTQLTLDMNRLREKVQARFGGPALLMVRLSGAELRNVEPVPLKRGQVGQDEFLLYDLGKTAVPAPGPLTMAYGVSARWGALVFTAALVWMLGPLAALALLRRGLQGRMAREGVRAIPEKQVAREALRSYRHWQRAAILGSLAGLGGTVLILGIAPFLYFVASNLGYLIPSLLFLPPSGVGLAGRLVGLPLERRAWPGLKERPWYRVAGTELLMAALLLVSLALSGFLLGRRGP